MSQSSSRRPKVALVFGTRPEAIKLAPVITELRQRGSCEVCAISTGQHRQMLDQVFAVYGLQPDIDLQVMQPNQSLDQLTSKVVTQVGDVLRKERVDLLVVQGDTTTAFVAALAAFYQRIPVAHVEAGLRSHDVENPFPEEVNRRLVSVVAAMHLAPTDWSRQQLLKEGISADRIVVTGNTVVDALEDFLDVPFIDAGTPLEGLDLDARRFIVVTSHRRESWGADLENICHALADLVRAHDDVAVIYPVHLNPNVRGTVHEILGGQNRIHLIEPLDYLTFVNLMRRATLLLTDSGGLQEEAPTLGKPLLLMRKVTERPEAFQAGMARLVGTTREAIVAEASRVLSDGTAYARMTSGVNPYGDGRASMRVATVIERWWRGERPLLEPTEEFRVPARMTLVTA